MKSHEAFITARMEGGMSQKTITRAELSEAVYQRIGLSRTDSSELVELV